MNPMKKATAYDDDKFFLKLFLLKTSTKLQTLKKQITFQACVFVRYEKQEYHNLKQKRRVLTLPNIKITKLKMTQFDSSPFNCHEWFGQFKSTVYSIILRDDEKRTYLKTLVAGEAKSVISY